MVSIEDKMLRMYEEVHGETSMTTGGEYDEHTMQYWLVFYEQSKNVEGSCFESFRMSLSELLFDYTTRDW